MTIEIRQPELQALIQQRMASGHFASVEDALRHALETAPRAPQKATTPARNGSDLVAALMRIPHKDVELEPERFYLHVGDPVNF
jgi:hypothetical protein